MESSSPNQQAEQSHTGESEFGSYHGSASHTLHEMMARTTQLNIIHSESGQLMGLCLALYGILSTVSEIVLKTGPAYTGSFTLGECLLHCFIIISAVYSIIHKGNAAGLIVVSILMLVKTLVDLPHTADHAILNVFLLPFVVTGVVLSNYNYPITHFRFINGYFKFGAPALLFVLIFNRLNTSFFDANFSCSAYLLAQSNQTSSGGVIYQFLPYFLVALPIAALLAMLMRKGGSAGLILGILSFGLLGAGQGGFAFLGMVMLFSLYSVMMSPNKLFSGRTPELEFDSMMIVKLVASCLCGALLYALVFKYSDRLTEVHVNTLYWTSVLAVLVFAFLGKFRKLSTAESPVGLMTAVVPAIILLVAAKPYLGVGNYHALTSFTNLQYHAGFSNHLLLPAVGRQLSSALEDQFSITRSQDDRFIKLNSKTSAIKFSKIDYIRTPAQPKNLPVAYNFTKFFIYNHLIERAGLKTVVPLTEFKHTRSGVKIVASKYEVKPRWRFFYKFLFSRPIPQNTQGLCYK